MIPFKKEAARSLFLYFGNFICIFLFESVFLLDKYAKNCYSKNSL